MNPSQFPQVLRSRSRSPSPAPRRLHRSDVGLESDSGDSSNRTTDDQELGNKDGGHLNFSFPCYDFDDTLRDANGHRCSQTPSPQCSGFEGTWRTIVKKNQTYSTCSVARVVSKTVFKDGCQQIFTIPQFYFF